MNILFLTIVRLDDIEEHSIYPDLLRQFRDHGHQVYVTFPRQKASGQKTEAFEKHGAHMLGVQIGNITKCGMIEKGISTLMIESQYKKAIQKHFADVKFDFVMYSTPPITLAGVVDYIKKRDGARSYLLLKDIFPQNAVDLGMMITTGPKSLIYKVFRKKEQKLYALSDRIGCMSPANVDFVLKHNPEIPSEKVEVCPNCIEPRDMSVTAEERSSMRKKYGIPEDKVVFVYGGNLGKPQGIPFLIDCIRSQKDNPEAFFLVVGSGTEYGKLEAFAKEEQQKNFKLMSALPKEDYDKMAASCDVGMIFLDHRFTIPNFPSRLLAYMQAKLPVLACTDPNTDVGRIAEDGGFGWWCESNSVEAFGEKVILACKADRAGMGKAADKYLKDHYSAEQGYNIVMESISKIR